jgi:YHS domain-containing protein
LVAAAPRRRRSGKAAIAGDDDMALAWLIRFLIAVVAVRMVWKFFSGLLEGAAERPQVPPKRGVMLVRDPVCGTYVDRSRAVSARGGGELHYFCSEDCRTAYRQGRRGSAARA